MTRSQSSFFSGESDGAWFAFLVTLIWALHPLQTAAVTYVAQRAESLAGLLYLLTLYGFVRAAECEPPDKRWAAFSVIVCSLGMATKETMVTVPVLMLLYDRAFVAGSWRAAWRARVRLHLTMASTWVILGCLVMVNHGRGGSAGFGAVITPWTYFLTQCAAIPHYLGLTFWPVSQIFDYGVPVKTVLIEVWPQLLFLTILAIGVTWALWSNRVSGFLGAAFFILLMPSSSFVPVATQTLAEHRMYLVLFVPVFLVVGGLKVWWGQRNIWVLRVFLGTLAIALGMGTFFRNRTYHSEIELWQDTVKKRPDNPRAHNNLGSALLTANRPDQAAVEFRKAIALQPNHAFAHGNLAVVLMAKRQWAEAADHLGAALVADPSDVNARVNLGHVLTALDRTKEAIEQYQIVLAQDSGAQDARTNLAALLIGQGRAEEAVKMLREAIAKAPELAEAHFHLGRGLEKMGDPAGATSAFREAIRLKPEWADAWLAQANHQMAQGDAVGAERSCRRALAFDPKLGEAHFALGNILAGQQKFSAASDAFRQALELDPENVEARNNLGNCWLVMGRFQEAIAAYDRVLQVRAGDLAVLKNRELAQELLRGSK